MSAQGKINIGISGWTYEPWRGTFYPKKLAHKNELKFAAETFEKWAAETPDDFVFSVKGPRFITHIKRLGDVRAPLANFFASGLLALGPKLGPILWQLPPNFGFDSKRLARFFELLPRSTSAAAGLAAHHDRRVKDPCLAAELDMPIRHAIEVRHRSFETPDFIMLLRRHRIALVVADTVEWPYIEDVTA